MSQYARVPGRDASESIGGTNALHTSTHEQRDGDTGVVFDVESGDEPSTHFDRNYMRRAAALFDRARFALGRFGQLVGMRVPGGSYTNIGERRTLPRHIGGGTIEDGVFSNLNAKPDQSRPNRDPNDRGDDDDLADDTLPPNYEAAAADCAPPYWETALFPGPHPLVADSSSWTPESEYAGPVPSLIVDELPIGSIVGFIWNLLISTLFQFVGFLVTFFLYSTHGAKYGSRAGLGATLIQFSFYLSGRISKAHEELNDPKRKKDDAPPPTEHQFKRASVASTLVFVVGLVLLLGSIWKFACRYSYGLRLAKERAPLGGTEQNEPERELPPPVGFVQSSDMVTTMNRSFGRLRDILMAEVGIPMDPIPEPPLGPSNINPIQHVIMANHVSRNPFGTIFDSADPTALRRF